ncbi:MAG: putative toxin-antitoxin system toxin component, PIN family [Aggregatilineales bacterium]
MIRAVLDTNIIVSGLLWRGLPWRVYSAATDKKFTLLASEKLLGEVARVLRYPKFATRLSILGSTAELIQADVADLAEVVDALEEISPDVIRDPKDRIVLACAVGGKADCIVSGDNDLLILNIFRGIPILTAERFLVRLAEQKP